MVSDRGSRLRHRMGLALALAVLLALGAFAAVSERLGRAPERAGTPSAPAPARPAAWPRPATATGPGGEVVETTRTPAPRETTPAPSGEAAPAPAADWREVVRGMVRPAGGPVQTPFGWGQSATLGDWRFHPGLDLRCPRGTPVMAALKGQVSGVEEEAGWGVTVTLAHEGGLVTVYSGLEGVAVAPGREVAAGSELGRVGPPGQWECELGPHLHFELRLEGEALDPSRFLR
ncbi:MAG: M23 family metallopeptidase [Acetobacteraceae bacterium]|nr:M23 family metallopeptidase [Acetobacteraceae bacterium]